MSTSPAVVPEAQEPVELLYPLQASRIISAMFPEFPCGPDAVRQAAQSGKLKAACKVALRTGPFLFTRAEVEEYATRRAAEIAFRAAK